MNSKTAFASSTRVVQRRESTDVGEWRLVASLGRSDRSQQEGGGRMLALTDNAVEAVQEILSSSDEVPEMGGLRLVAEPVGAQMNFQLTVVALPGEDDEVIEEQ